MTVTWRRSALSRGAADCAAATAVFGGFFFAAREFGYRPQQLAPVAQ
jgi:hypothetical protein